MSRLGPARNSTILAKPAQSDPVGMARFVDQVVRAVDLPPHATVVSAAAQVGSDRRVLIQVVDRNRFPLPGRFIVQAFAALAVGGGPSGTATFAAPVKGTLINAGGSVRTYASDADGRVEFDLARGSAGPIELVSGVGGALSPAAPIMYV